MVLLQTVTWVKLDKLRPDLPKGKITVLPVKQSPRKSIRVFPWPSALAPYEHLWVSVLLTLGLIRKPPLIVMWKGLGGRELRLLFDLLGLEEHKANLNRTKLVSRWRLYFVFGISEEHDFCALSCMSLKYQICQTFRFFLMVLFLSGDFTYFSCWCNTWLVPICDELENQSWFNLWILFDANCLIWIFIWICTFLFDCGVWSAFSAVCYLHI